MSLIKKSDLKNHRSKTAIPAYPFGFTRSDAPTAKESKEPSAQAEIIDISISPSRPISPEAVPNAGGSVSVLP